MKQHPQDHSDHQTLHHQDPKITAKQFAAQLKHPALQPAHSPMKAQSPNPSVLVHFSTPSPSLSWEGKNENFHSLLFLLFVNSFTAHVMDPLTYWGPVWGYSLFLPLFDLLRLVTRGALGNRSLTQANSPTLSL